MTDDEHRNLWDAVNRNSACVSRVQVELQKLRGAVQEEVSLRRVNHENLRDRMISDHEGVRTRLSEIERELREIGPVLRNIIFLFKLFSTVLGTGAAAVLIIEFFW